MTFRGGSLLLLIMTAGGSGLHAEPEFLSQASSLLDQGKIEQAGLLAQQALDANPDDADALVVAGTAVLYTSLKPGRDESVDHPLADPAGPPVEKLSPSGAQAVAAFWKRVPALDPTRASLWGDLAQLTYRSGDPAGAEEYARHALATQDPEALRAAALVFVLNLEWNDAVSALSRIPGDRSGLLLQGLNLWRTAQDGWRAPLKSFAANPGSAASGAKLASYLAGPEMRDTESGFLEALKTESVPAALAVHQKYVDRYANNFLARMNFARTLSRYGSFVKALEQYSEIDRLKLAVLEEERQSVVFYRAWALQAMGRGAEADQQWTSLTDAKEFYLRSAADWFLGENAASQNKIPEAKDWWAKIAGEPTRSKYAYWAAEELKKLEP